MTYDLSKVHETNLKILKEIDRICRKYKIKYVLDAGTLLGAVRHKGFIPWDDDADIAFTRDNYEAFKKVVKRELAAGMTFMDCEKLHGGKGFYDFTSRILYDNSKKHEDTPEMEYYDGKLNHLWVDLFVIDVLPENRLNAKLILLMHTVIYGLSMGHRFSLEYKKHSLLQRVAIGGLAAVGKCIPMPLLFTLQHKLAVKDRNSKSNLRYYSNYQPDYLYVTLQKQWCEEVTDMEFCDTKLMVPCAWDEVLTWIYGDYRKLPPEEERVPVHSSIEIQIDNVL